MAPLLYSETFAAAGARISSTISSIDGTTTNATGAATGFGGGVSLSYDAATGGYTVVDANGASATFLPSSKNPGESNADVSVYNQASASGDEQLYLFNPGAGNTKLALSYASYGVWQRGVDNGATLDVSQQYFVYGIRQGANQPSTGSASYSTVVDGVWVNAGGVYALGGMSSFTADFSAMTVATSLQLTGINVSTAGGDAKTLGNFSGTGSIAALGGGFSGTLTQSGTDDYGNTYSGSFNGAFFGPQGQEMGYTYSLTGVGGAAAGAVVGKAN